MGFMPISDLIAGFCAGCSQLIVGQPLDFIKTKIQTSVTKKSILQSMKEIYHEYGLRGFYRGSSSIFMGIGAAIALQFSVYQYCKRLCRQYLNIKKDAQLPLNYIGLSGLGVGLAVCFLYCPIQYAKIYQQTQKQSKYRGSFHALWNIMLQKGGIRRLYNGYLSILMRDLPGCYVYYYSYEATLLYFSPNRNDASLSHYLAAGSAAGLGYWTYAYPFDTIKTKVQSGQTYSQVFKSIASNVSVLFRGFPVVLVRSIPVNAVSFMVYESVQKILKQSPYLN